MRIVSLIPASTGIVCALGLEDRMVGRPHACDFPASIRKLPACTEANLITEAPSAKIALQLKEILEQALGIYRVDAAVL